jgi:uncharacterized protein YodC (DUF2158 family)
MAKVTAIEVGDVVRLKSGGPRMTVAIIDSPQTAQVVWFENPGNLRTAKVTINSLTTKGGK